MGFDMNSGYSGWSMSKNAVAAYHDGEMPKSKWTKKAILAALESYCDEYDLVFTEPKGTKAELFDRFVEYKSWHHTSKFCNTTDFYGIDEDAADEAFPPMTEEQVEARDAARKAAREQAEAEHRARIEAAEAKAAAEAAWAAERGYERRSVLHYAELHPEECETVLNRKGEPIVRIVHGEKTYVYEKAKAGSIILYWWADEWKEN